MRIQWRLQIGIHGLCWAFFANSWPEDIGGKELTFRWHAGSSSEAAANGHGSGSPGPSDAQANGEEGAQPVSGPPSRIPSLASPAPGDPLHDPEAVQPEAAVPMPGAKEGASGGSDVLRDTRTAQLASLAEQADIRHVASHLHKGFRIKLCQHTSRKLYSQPNLLENCHIYSCKATIGRIKDWMVLDMLLCS